MDRPTQTVSIIIPCRNEQYYIARCLDSLLTNDYPQHLLDIVVVDGMSDDRTREIVQEYAQRYGFIRLLDNPEKNKPAALNLGIAATDSDVVMRIDAHATYASDYIAKLVHGLDEHQVDNMGGVRETAVGQTVWSRAVSLAISHPFAAGNALYRTGLKDTRVRLVDTVFCGCYRRSVFQQIGDFNRSLLRAQDRELNARLLAHGGKIALDPTVRCTYYPRTSWTHYAKWVCQGAYWLYYAHRFCHTRMYSARNFVPGLFLFWHAWFGICLIWLPQLAYLMAAPLILYWLLNAWLAGKAALQYRSTVLAPALMLLFATTHYAYGVGSWCGFIAAAWKGKSLDEAKPMHSPTVQIHRAA